MLYSSRYILLNFVPLCLLPPFSPLLYAIIRVVDFPLPENLPEKIMYAIIETGGKQYWVKPGQDLQVEKLEAEVGSTVELKVLWAANEEGTSADTKAAQAAKVTAQVVKHLRGQKVIVYKRRPKKGYERTQGHRQNLTQIKITDIQL